MLLFDSIKNRGINSNFFFEKKKKPSHHFSSFPSFFHPSNQFPPASNSSFPYMPCIPSIIPSSFRASFIFLPPTFHHLLRSRIIQLLQWFRCHKKRLIELKPGKRNCIRILMISHSAQVASATTVTRRQTRFLWLHGLGDSVPTSRQGRSCNSS